MKSAFEFKPDEVQTDMIDGTGRLVCWRGDRKIAVVDFKETPFVLEPHVEWITESTREKYESFLWALDGWKKTVFLIIKNENKGFYEQITKRGFLRKIGVLKVLQANEEIHMYQKAEDD